MKRLKLDELWDILPDLEELQPVLDELVLRSVPDADRAWSGAAEVATLGDRLVPKEGRETLAEDVVKRVREHLMTVYGRVVQALALLEAGDTLGAARLFVEIAEIDGARNRPDRAARWAEAAHRLTESERDRSVAALALRRWGRALRVLGEYEQGLQRYAEAFDICEALGATREACEAAVGAGNVLEELGRWDEAEEWYRRALDLLDRAGLVSPPERWHALLNLHIVLRSQGRLEASIPLLEQAQRAAAGDPTAPPFLGNARGQLLQVRGDHPSAVEHFRQAIDDCGEVFPRLGMTVNLAESLLAMGRHLDAADVAREAEREAVQVGAVTRLPEVYRMLGRIAAEVGQPEAFVLFARALEIVRTRRLSRLEEARTLQAYAEAEAMRGESESARSLHEAAAALYRDLGIAQLRHPWSEFFGPGANEQTHEKDDETDG